MDWHQFDLVVVGAGPAGAAAALAAAQAGHRVLMLEKKKAVGSPVQCAEYVPQLINHYAPPPPEAIALRTNGMRTFIGVKGDGHFTRAPGFILHRALYDAALAAQACRAGADLWVGAKAIKRLPQGLLVARNGQEIQVQAQVIIGADGPHSTVGRWMDSRNRELVTALQYEIPLPPHLELKETEIYFHPSIPGGYGWLFPKGATANVGVGIHPAVAGVDSPSSSLKQALVFFLDFLAEQKKILPGKILRVTGGSIPVGGPLSLLQEDNLLLVGDAAGMAHPVTGAGILNAVISGRLAGQVASQALKVMNLSLLSAYPQMVREELGYSLSWANERRAYRDANWTSHLPVFQSLIQKTWIAYPQYYPEKEETAYAGKTGKP